MELQYKEKDFESFFETPFIVRGENSFYASPFKSDFKKILSTENPLFKCEDDFSYFTVFKNGKPAGRITAHVHRAFNNRFNTNKCYFGFFECINDAEVANRLLELAERWAKKNGFESIAGNFNMTAMQEMGIVTGGFDNEPYIAQSYGQAHYPVLLEQAGYSPGFPMSTFEVDIEKFDPEKMVNDKIKEILNDPDYEFLPITAKMYNKIRPVFLNLFNKAFDNNPLFVPISQEEFDFQAKDLVYFLDKDIAILAKHKGEPVAVNTNVPDINPFLRKTRSRLNITTPFHYLKHKFRKDRALCIFGAVLPEYHNRGIAGTVLYLTLKAMKKSGYRKYGITWVSENNKGSLKKMSDMDARRLHELRIFEKNLIKK